MTNSGTTPIVLVVDDEAVLTNMFREALTIEGFTVEIAGDGQEAVAILAQTPQIKRVMLLDIQMKIMNGIEVIRWLGDHPEIRQNLRLVIMTANHRIAEFMYLDHDAVLGKPFGMDTVLDLLSPM